MTVPGIDAAPQSVTILCIAYVLGSFNHFPVDILTNEFTFEEQGACKHSTGQVTEASQ